MKKNSKPKSKQQTVSLFRKLIDIYHEQALAKKAVRTLAKQEWSLEFLEYLCAKCSKETHNDVQIVVKDPKGRQLIVQSKPEDNKYVQDEDILQHLDDVAAIDDFIRRHSK